jgi:hypothetical protein
VDWIKLAEDMLKLWAVMKKKKLSGFIEEQDFFEQLSDC